MVFFIFKKDLKKLEYNKNYKINIKKFNTMFFFLGLKMRYTNLIKFSGLLNYMFGIGYKKYIPFFFSRFGFSFNFLLSNVSVIILQNLQFVIRNLLLNYDYKKKIDSNIFFKKKLKMYSGFRHSLFLSVRGQRTKTNCGTQKKRRFLAVNLNNVNTKQRVRKRKRK